MRIKEVSEDLRGWMEPKGAGEANMLGGMIGEFLSSKIIFKYACLLSKHKK